MRRGVRGAVAALVLGLAPGGGSAWGQVELRSRERLEGPVADASLVGVKMAPIAEGEAARVVGWDRVKEVKGDGAAKAAPFATIADKLWRARTRLERGDIAGAEPLFDSLADVYAGEDGPSAAVVAEGLLRCRLARGAQSAATWSWLNWVRLMERSGGVGVRDVKGTARAGWIGGGIDLAPVVDAGTGLAPALSPVWAPGSATQAAAGSPEWGHLRARGGVTAELATLYEKAARFEAGLDQEIVLATPLAGTAGTALVREIVLARGGSAAERETARQALRSRLQFAAGRAGGSKGSAAAMPRWVEAWVRIGLGRSLIREENAAERIRGVVELLHLPARFMSDQPYLAGVALADAVVTLAEIGDAGGAAALRGELQARLPTHPVLQWEKLTRVKDGAGTN